MAPVVARSSEMNEELEQEQKADWPQVQDEDDFELPAKACDLSGEGTCEACQ